MKYIDLFCGIGSFHASFDKLGFECIMACDNNSTVCETYLLNYGVEPMGDITEIDVAEIPNYDILCGGFPCQPFSIAGKSKGFKDENRGNMFIEIMRFVHFHRPPFVILENVAQLLTHGNGDTFNCIKSELNNAGYNIAYKVLKCSDYGIPQMRKRLFILATRKDIKTDVDVFDLTEYEQKETLSNFLEKSFLKDEAYTIRCGGKSSGINDRHNWDTYHILQGGQKNEYKLTIKDALKLQGFDEDFQLCGNTTQMWKAVGNTIPTIFTEMMGRQILKIARDSAQLEL